MNKKTSLTTIIILIATVMFSCGQKVETHYPDGSIKSKGLLKNGKKHGLATLYHKNGQVAEKGNWDNDKQQGEWLFYYDNGILSSKVNFEDDMQNGLTFFYSKDGKLYEESNWKDGALNGISKTFYPNGQLKEQFNWIQGEKKEKAKSITKVVKFNKMDIGKIINKTENLRHFTKMVTHSKSVFLQKDYNMAHLKRSTRMDS